MKDNKKYYWLKLNENFFEDDTISWIEEQENGKDYVLFYLKLVLKSLSEEGYLIRYVGEKLIPYDVAALAKITNTVPDTVKVAMNLFLEIGLISMLETGEIYINQIEEMIGSETESAKRVRKHRVKKALEEEKNTALQCNSGVIKSNTEIEKEREKELDKEIEKEIDKNSSSTSNLKKMAQSFTNNERLLSAIYDFINYRKLNKSKFTVRALELNLNNLKDLSSDDNERISILNQSIERGWSGLFAIKNQQSSNNQVKSKRYYHVEEKKASNTDCSENALSFDVENLEGMNDTQRAIYELAKKHKKT